MNRSDRLNIGCGRHFLADWENLDFDSRDPAVRGWDVRRGLPYADASYAVVYCSHVLEHLSNSEAGGLLDECRRVLRPAGTLRLVVPDLEILARNYLEALDSAAAEGSAQSDARACRYQWACILLLDQLTRTAPTGEQGRLLEVCQGRVPGFLREWFGDEWLNAFMPPPGMTPPAGGVWSRIRVGLRWRGRAIRERAATRLKRTLPGIAEWAERRRIAAFLRSGERHQWMYDRYSLRQLLEQRGFSDVRQVAHDETRSNCGDVIRLDCTADGKPYKPLSLYMEAVSAIPGSLKGCRISSPGQAKRRPGKG